MPKRDDENTVALFVDADNIIRPLDQRLERLNLESIVRRVREYGILILARAYGDWGYLPCRDYIRDFSQFGIEMAQLHSDMKGKNTADMQMTVDSLEHCMSSHTADIFILVSGDRDFVPLVQVLRRLGKYVIGICVDEAASQVLQKICDVYISYDALQKKRAPVASEPPKVGIESREGSDVKAVYDERTLAHQTLVDAIIAVKRRDQPIIGGNVNQVMRQLLPSFDFISLGYDSFKEFVEDAKSKGMVIITPPAGGLGDFLLDVPSKDKTVIESAASNLSYDTVEEAVASYRLLLDRKRIPWVAWKFREPLIKRLWERLEERGDVGMLGDDIVEEMLDFAWEREWNVTEAQAVKLVYTLNIGYCYKVNGVPQRSSDILNSFVTPAVDVEQAFDFMHIAYLRGMKFEDPKIIFKSDAVAQLLFDTQDKAYIKTAQDLIYGVYGKY